MIRPLPRHSQARENLSYPKYGEFGYEQPVGRKHLSNKLSAIHKIIFNEETQPISRDTYNEVKMNFNGSFLDNARQNSSRFDKYSHNYGENSRIYQNGRESSNREYEKDRRYGYDSPNRNSDVSYNIIQNQYSERYSPSNSKKQQKQDCLDSILNPYIGRDLKRQISMSSNNSYQYSSPQLQQDKINRSPPQINHDISQKYSINSIEKHRTNNPTFLNSLL